MDVFEAQFWLFIPESVGKVKEVWLVLKGSSDKIMMTRKDKEMVWIARKKITRSSEYQYIVQMKDSVFSVLAAKAAKVAKVAKVDKFLGIQKKDNQPEDVEWRPVSEHVIQKDILPAEYESKDKTAAYSYFLTRMLEGVQTNDQLKQQIEDFTRKHSKLLEPCLGLAELAYNLVYHFTRDRGATPLKAVFVVYVLAVLNKHSGFLNDLVKRIDPKSLKVLIENMKSSTFELLAKEKEVKSENVIIALVECYVGSKCTFTDLVFYGYPAVSSQMILENRDKYSAAGSASEKTVISATKRLCRFLDKTETVCELLHETVRRGDSFMASLHVLSFLHTKKPQELEHGALGQLRRQVTDFATEQIYSCKSFDQLYQLYAVMDDSYQDLMSEFSCAFELMVLNIEEHTITQEQIKQLKHIILNQDFFKGQKHAVALLTIVASSAKFHCLFPELLTIFKFAETLSADPSSCLPQLIKLWLDTARQINDRFGYDHLWYDYIFSITQSEIIGQNEELLAASTDMILHYFYAAARKSITCCADVAKLALDSSLLVEDQNIEKTVFNALSCELEQYLIKLARTRESLIEKEEQEAFYRLLMSHLLFTERQTSIAILEAVAGSEDSNVHGMFVRVMLTGKFCKQLNQIEAGKIFQMWFEAAENFHCKKNHKLHDFSDSILQLYQVLADVVLSIPPEYNILKEELESYMKKELAGLSISTRLTLVKPPIAPKVRPNTLALLEKHLTEMEDGTLPKRELEIRLKSYSETRKTDQLQRQVLENFLSKGFTDCLIETDKCVIKIG